MNRIEINWRERLKGEPEPGIHFHGYVWVGQGGHLDSIKTQAQRTAGTEEFPASDLPPEAVHHYLLKRRQLAGTWAEAKPAAEWMREQWDAHTPTVTHVAPDNTQQFHEVTLSIGKSTVWSWWFPEPGSTTKVHVTVAVCRPVWPQFDAVRTPCPQPPE